MEKIQNLWCYTFSDSVTSILVVQFFWNRAFIINSKQIFFQALRIGAGLKSIKSVEGQSDQCKKSVVSNIKKKNLIEKDWKKMIRRAQLRCLESFEMRRKKLKHILWYHVNKYATYLYWIARGTNIYTTRLRVQRRKCRLVE